MSIEKIIQHDKENPEHVWDEIWTCINCYEERLRSEERERIITLLESIKDYPRGWDYDDPIESVIALIKGEQK